MREHRAAPRLSYRYHRMVARHLAELVPGGARILLVDPPHPCYAAELPAERLLVAARSGEDAAAIRQAAPDREVVAAPLEELASRGPFDAILLPSLLPNSHRLWEEVRQVAEALCSPETRVILPHYSFLWEPVVKLAQWLGLRREQRLQNWLAPGEVTKLLKLAGLELVRVERFALMPLEPGAPGRWVNRFLAPLPLLRHLCFQHACIARAVPRLEDRRDYSVTVVIPTRNERGNIRAAVESVPEMGTHTEILFVDGASTDGTVEAIQEEIERHRGSRDIRLLHQVEPGEIDEAERRSGKMLRLGKGHAVHKAFQAARGEMLMILDGDLTVPPEALPQFYLALKEGHGELINGNRLAYPQEGQAMRLLNLLANKLFGYLFSYLMGQDVADTLCGTKVILKKDYEILWRNRAVFGEFDPFGDFDLLFGAARLNLKITEVFVRYRDRSYGDIKIERFRHGLLLLEMSWIGFQRLKLRLRP